MASLAKWLSVRLKTKWLWVRIPLLSLLISAIFHFLFIFHSCDLMISLSTVSLIDKRKFHPKIVSLPFEIFIFPQVFVSMSVL